MLDGIEANRLITTSLRSGKPFAVGRIGLSEVNLVYWYMTGGLQSECNKVMKPYDDEYVTLEERLEPNGIYGGCGDEFFAEFIKGIKAADIQVYWNQFGIEPQQDHIFANHSNHSIKVHSECLYSFMHPDFWSKALEGKKVLIVHAHQSEIEKQYAIREKLWTGAHAGKVPTFGQLITYKPAWVMGATKPHSSWLETLNAMKADISKLEFDVAIMACSHFGMPLLAHIKNTMGKTAIYQGGELQILFGIKGARWDNNPHVAQHYNNENWTRPSEKPDNHYVLDGGCYW